MLSPRVYWLTHAPAAYTIGDLYMQAEMPSGFRQWLRVTRVAKRMRLWWLRHVLNNTSAISVEIIYPV